MHSGASGLQQTFSQKPEQMQAEAEALSMRAKHDLQEDLRGGLHGAWVVGNVSLQLRVAGEVKVN